MNNGIPKKSTLLEKVFYSAGGLGGGVFCWSFISGFMTMYYTNSVGMAAASVGTMMLVARFLDGFTDIIFGVMMEKFPSKRLGKTRHWTLLSVIMLPICILLCFNVPSGMSGTGQIAYMYGTYILVSAIGYTIYGGAFSALMARMSEDKKDIEHISVSYMLATMIGVTVMYMLATNLLTKMDPTMGSQAGWSKVAAIFAIICAIGVFLQFLIKEKGPVQTDGEKIEKTPIKEGLKVCMKYKYFWLILLIFISFQLASGLMSGANTYYIGYVLGDFGIVNITSIPNMIAQIIAFLSVPVILKKVDKIVLMKYSLILFAVAKVLPIISIKSVPLYVFSGILATVAIAPTMSLIYTLTVDFIIYVSLKTGMRAEGFAGIGSTVGTKVGVGIGSAMIGWILALGKFDGMAAVQGDAAVTSIIFLAAVIPAIAVAVTTVGLFLWDLNKKMPEAQAEAEARNKQ